MGMNISRARAETHATAGEERALQAGIALASHHSAAAALAEASSVKALSSALERNLASGLTSDILIGRVVSADLLRLQRLTVGITALQGMNPLLEADQERRERLAELLNPCRGALEALRMQTSGLERVAEASNASLRRMAEACAPRIAPMEIGLGLNAIAALGSVGNLAAVTALADLHVPVRIHAVPRLPSQSAPRPGRCREAFLDRPPLSPVPEAPSHPQPTGWMEANRRVATCWWTPATHEWSAGTSPPHQDTRPGSRSRDLYDTAVGQEVALDNGHPEASRETSL